LVTGSTVGIGFAIARGLARERAEVIVNGRTEQKVAEAVQRISSEVGSRAAGISADLGRSCALSRDFGTGGHAGLLKCSSAHFFYERTVLAHFERVRQLPPEAQAEIALRVRNFLELARPVSDDFLSRFAQVARDEQQRAAEQGAKSHTDPLLAAPVMSEAWCNARMGLVTGNLNRHSATEIIAAIETFTLQQASKRRRSV
jgi:NAD(P)-dependent dehydrogenase (short-subunit alcohol dehydrogenase family)